MDEVGIAVAAVVVVVLVVVVEGAEAVCLAIMEDRFGDISAISLTGFI